MRVKRVKRSSTPPAVLSDEAKAFLANPTPQPELTGPMWELVMAGLGVATTTTDDTMWTFRPRA